MHILVVHHFRNVAYVMEVGEERWDCHSRRRLNWPMAYLVCHIEVDSAGHHGIRHTVVEEVESIRMVAGGEEVAGSRNHLVVEADRNSAVGSSLAGVGTAVMVVLRILRGIQLLGNLTWLCVRGVEKNKKEMVFASRRPNAEGRFRGIRDGISRRG